MDGPRRGPASMVTAGVRGTMWSIVDRQHFGKPHGTLRVCISFRGRAGSTRSRKCSADAGDLGRVLTWGPCLEIAALAVLLQRNKHAVVVVRRQGEDQALVAFDSGARTESGRVAAQIGRHGALQLEEDRCDGQVQLPVAGQGDHRGVEGTVGVVLPEIVAGVIGRRHLIQAAAYGGERVRTVVAAEGERLIDGITLEEGTQAEQLVDIGLRELRDAGAAPGQVLDQTLAGEVAQRLPERGTADGETLPDLLLDKSLTRLELTREDLGAEPAAGHLDQTGDVQAVVAHAPPRLQASRSGIRKQCRSARGARLSRDQPRMKSSTRSRALASSYCTGGLFMKYALGPSRGPPMPRS